MNSPINLHWNDEVCIADGLRKMQIREKIQNSSNLQFIKKKTWQGGSQITYIFI